MAPMKERFVCVFKRMDKKESTQKKFGCRHYDIEREAIARDQKLAFAKRIFGMNCASAVGLAFNYLS